MTARVIMLMPGDGPTHIEETDRNGNPTGHALCDDGESAPPRGRLARNAGTATCQACIDWEPDEDEEI